MTTLYSRLGSSSRALQDILETERKYPNSRLVVPGGADVPFDVPPDTPDCRLSNANRPHDGIATVYGNFGSVDNYWYSRLFSVAASDRGSSEQRDPDALRRIAEDLRQHEDPAAYAATKMGLVHPAFVAGWEALGGDGRLEMERALDAKFNGCTLESFHFFTVLSATRRREIRVLGDDPLWNMAADGTGQNLLGVMLVRLRDRLKGQSYSQRLRSHALHQGQDCGWLDRACNDEMADLQDYMLDKPEQWGEMMECARATREIADLPDRPRPL